MDAAALRADRCASLPDYMVPSAIVVLERLPLTPNGKLDRRALPAPDLTAAARARPRTPQEEVLCGLFAEVLGLERVGIDDNFFELGGDSIMSIQLVSRARKAGLVITPRAVFQHQTVEALAGVAAAGCGSRLHGARLASGSLAGDANHALADGAWRPDRSFQTSRAAAGAGGSARGPSASGRAGGTRSSRCVTSAIGEGHPRLALEFGNCSAGCSEGARPSASGRRRERGGLTLADIEAHTRAAEDRLLPTAGTMVQAVWFDAGSERPGRLLLMMHHLAVDWVSWRILEPDLATAYAAITNGAAPALPARRASFRKWSERLAAQAENRGGRRRRVLERNARPAHAYRSSKAPSIGNATSPELHEQLRFALPASVTESLLTRVPAVFHAGTNDVLVRALLGLVARRAGGRQRQSCSVDRSEGHGREEIYADLDLSRTVGSFTSLFPMRVDCGTFDLADALAGGLTMGRVFKLIKEQLRAVPDNGIGYGLLRYLNPHTASQLLALARPQIRFGYYGRFTAEPRADWNEAPQVVTVAAGDPAIPLAHCLEIQAVTQDTREGAVYWPPAFGRRHCLTKQPFRDTGSTLVQVP